jgi:hypothetical protein
VGWLSRAHYFPSRPVPQAEPPTQHSSRHDPFIVSGSDERVGRFGGRDRGGTEQPQPGFGRLTGEMKRSARLAIAVMACMFAASGCASFASAPQRTQTNSAGSPPPPSSPTSVRESVSGISFERPADWTRWQPNQHSPMNDGPLIYLSTDPLLPACATMPAAAPDLADGQGRACAWPITELGSNGVLVIWLTTRVLQPLPGTGEAIEVDRATAHLQITKPGGCGAMKADETIDVLVPIGQPTPHSNLAVIACLRGPDLGSAEAKVRTMLRSATVSLGAVGPSVDDRTSFGQLQYRPPNADAPESGRTNRITSPALTPNLAAPSRP